MALESQPAPTAFLLANGPVGVLLIHGYTGSPPEMRLIGDYLHVAGLTISGPLLPGHGTTVKDMNRRKWQEWTTHVEQALTELKSHCQSVFVGGLSMGSLLTLYLAARHPELKGILLYSPPVRPANRLLYLTPIIKYFAPSRPKSSTSDLTDPQAHQYLWSYSKDPTFAAHELLKLIWHVRHVLPKATCPALVIHSTGDTTIDPASAQCTYDCLGSSDKRIVTLHNSGHCITVDSEWETVAKESYAFIRQHQ